jgi:hypothetical protein
MHITAPTRETQGDVRREFNRKYPRGGTGQIFIDSVDELAHMLGLSGGEEMLANVGPVAGAANAAKLSKLAQIEQAMPEMAEALTKIKAGYAEGRSVGRKLLTEVTGISKADKQIVEKAILEDLSPADRLSHLKEALPETPPAGTDEKGLIEKGKDTVKDMEEKGKGLLSSLVSWPKRHPVAAVGTAGTLGVAYGKDISEGVGNFLRERKYDQVIPGMKPIQGWEPWQQKIVDQGLSKKFFNQEWLDLQTAGNKTWTDRTKAFESIKKRYDEEMANAERLRVDQEDAADKGRMMLLQMQDTRRQQLRDETLSTLNSMMMAEQNRKLERYKRMVAPYSSAVGSQ